MRNASIAHSGRHPTPKAVIVTGKVTGSDVERLEKFVGKDTVPLLLNGDYDGVLMESAGTRAKTVLEHHGLVPGVDGVVGKGEVWGF